METSRSARMQHTITKNGTEECCPILEVPVGCALSKSILFLGNIDPSSEEIMVRSGNHWVAGRGLLFPVPANGFCFLGHTARMGFKQHLQGQAKAREKGSGCRIVQMIRNLNMCNSQYVLPMRGGFKGFKCLTMLLVCFRPIRSLDGSSASIFTCSEHLN